MQGLHTAVQGVVESTPVLACCRDCWLVVVAVVVGNNPLRIEGRNCHWVDHRGAVELKEAVVGGSPSGNRHPFGVAVALLVGMRVAAAAAVAGGTLGCTRVEGLLMGSAWVLVAPWVGAGLGTTAAAAAAGCSHCVLANLASKTRD